MLQIGMDDAATSRPERSYEQTSEARKRVRCGERPQVGQTAWSGVAVKKHFMPPILEAQPFLGSYVISANVRSTMRRTISSMIAIGTPICGSDRLTARRGSSGGR